MIGHLARLGRIAVLLLITSALPAQGSMWPTWQLRGLDGTEVSLASLRGDITLVHRWATWCGLCLDELQTLDRLRQRVRAEGLPVAFVMVAPESRATITRFVARRPLALPWYVEAGAEPAVLTATALPTTFLLDRAGRVLLIRRGATDWDTAAVLDWLRAAVSSPR